MKYWCRNSSYRGWRTIKYSDSLKNTFFSSLEEKLASEQEKNHITKIPEIDWDNYINSKKTIHCSKIKEKRNRTKNNLYILYLLVNWPTENILEWTLWKTGLADEKRII